MRIRFLGIGAAGVALMTATGAANDSTFKLSGMEIPALTPALTSASTRAVTPSSRPTPPPVVPYEMLIPFLPEPPKGWTAEKPSGSTTDLEVFTLSTATRTYQKGDDDEVPVATVTIIDAGGHKGYFDATTSAWKPTEETPDGYDRVVDIDGMRGFQHVSKTSNSCSLCVFAAKRFFVQIELTNLDPSELRTWLKKIDLKKLELLK